MVVPGLTGLSSEVIGQFLEEGALLRYGVYQGRRCSGSRPRAQTIAQDVPLISQHVDYVADGLPDLWGLGEYEVPNPEAQPYDIVSRSLLDFQMPSSRWAGRWSVAAGLHPPHPLRPGRGAGADAGRQGSRHRQLAVLGSGHRVHDRRLSDLELTGPTVGPMEREQYLDALAVESAVRRRREHDAARCAGASLPGMDGGRSRLPPREVHYFWGEVARGDWALPRWSRRPARRRRAGVLGVRQAAELGRILGDADPAASVWTWAPQKDVAFIVRRMALETAVHRWDAEAAAASRGRSTPSWPATASTSSSRSSSTTAPEGARWAAPSTCMRPTRRGSGSCGRSRRRLDRDRGTRQGRCRGARSGQRSAARPLAAGRARPLEVLGDRDVAERLVARTTVE